MLFALSLAPPATGQTAPTTNWRMRTIAGGRDAGDGGKASLASIRYLQGVAVDGAGWIYFCDADDHRVRRIDGNGIITTLAGDGVPGFSGDDGDAALARVNTPYGITLTATGDLVFADLGNARIRRINRQGRIETIAGGGTRSLPPAGLWMNAREVKLIAPRNVAAAQNGSLFLSEFGANRILEWRPDGTLTTVNGGQTGWNAPAGLSIEPEGTLLIADSGNGLVKRLRASGVTEVVLGTKDTVALERPTGVASPRDGTILVADTKADYLWRLDPSSAGVPRPFPPGGRDVALDALGNVITAGGPWLRRANPQGLLEILIGNTYSTYRGDGGPALAARLNRPVGVAVDSKGVVYFSDTANHRIRAIGLDGTIRTVAGRGEAFYGGDGGPAALASLNSPTGLAVDAFDNVYVADTGNHRVRVLVPDGVIQTVAGTGRGEFSLDGLPATSASLSSPYGLAIDAQGNVYVSERGQARVRRFAVGGRISTVAGSAVRGSGGDGGDALLANLNDPHGLALDSKGNLYIADAGNGAVRMVDATSGRITTLLKALKGVESLTLADDGSLFVCETFRYRVLRRAPNGDTTVVAGRTDENGFNGETGGALELTLNEPMGLALTRDGNLLVADRLNDRLRALEAPVALPPTPVLTPRFELVHAATGLATAAAPGMLLRLKGPVVSPELAEVTLDGYVAPLNAATASDVVFLVPEVLAGRPETRLEFRVGGALLWNTTLPLVAAAPGLFEVPGQPGLVAAVNAAGDVVTDTNPAAPGDWLTVYGTGQGLLTKRDGLDVFYLPLTLSVNGLAAEVAFAGAAPGMVGLFQINFRVPSVGRTGGRVPLVVRLGTAANPLTQVVSLL